MKVAESGAVPTGQMKGYTVKMQPVLVANVDGDLYALEDQCSHEAYPLSDGELQGTDVMCIYHGARFDVCTGRNKGLPAVRPVKSYPVETRDDGIWVEL
jgi:3-phenylpropionate/trans-cinnamate dioxygenase ferredoxin subunit